MKAQFYEKPKTALDAVKILDVNIKKGKNVRILAGGTDLALEIHERKVRPDGVVDIGGIESLKDIRLTDMVLEIGAMCTFSMLEKHPLVLDFCPALAKAASSVGSPQIRTVGTLGGNFVNCAAAADTIPVLLAMEASAVIQSLSGTQIRPVEEMLHLKKGHLLKPGELLLGFRIPVGAGKMGFAKIGRRKALAIARINIAVAFSESSGLMKDVRIALGAVGKTAYRVTEIEALFNDKQLSAELISDSGTKLQALVSDRLGARPTAPYKKKIAAAVLEKCFGEFI